MKLLELKGLKSLRALNTFHRLMLGLKMTPSYMHEDYDKFFERIEKLEPAKQRALLKEAAIFVDLSFEEYEAMACFAMDENGRAYEMSSLRALPPPKLVEILVEVGMAFMAINLDFVTEAEKKK